MKREFLRGLGIDEEHIPKILDEHHDSLREYKDSASKVEDLEAQLQTANDELANRDNQIQQLKDSAPDNETLQQQLDDMKADNEKYQENLKAEKLNNAIRMKAVKEGAIDPDDVLDLLDKDGLELSEDGKEVKGLDDRFSEFKEKKAHHFGKPKTGRTPTEGNEPTGTLSKSQIMQIQDPKERQKAIKENMQLFD